jgi:nitrogen fixation-related uncharacterized protein
MILINLFEIIIIGAVPTSLFHYFALKNEQDDSRYSTLNNILFDQALLAADRRLVNSTSLM